MPEGSDSRVGDLLDRLRDGDGGASHELFGLLYEDLHRVAMKMFRSQRSSHTLQPTALVHEAYLKVARPSRAGTGWNDRAHFLAVAATAMRQVLVNHARDRAAAKRGGSDKGARVTLSDVPVLDAERAVDVLAVHEAIEALSALDTRQARIAELKFFAGLSNQEAADVLGVSLRTVELDWRMAKA